MSRSTSKLTATAIEKRKLTGRMGDGAGLWLNISKTGRKAWVFRWKPTGRPVKEMGLGGYPAVSLKMARELAAECREHVAVGKDPRKERDRVKVGRKTFWDVAILFLDDKASQWSNEKHKQQWHNTLRDYCTTINRQLIDEIELDDVLTVLRPIWNEKPETASRLRGRIERVLSYAMTRGWRTKSNPAIWRGNLDTVLPKPVKLKRGHHASMHWRDVPAFMERLRDHDALAARSLQLLILTACRSGEVLNAKWDEFQFDDRVWVLPAERMKTRKEYRVPLTDAAIVVLEPLQDARLNEWVFPGQSVGKPLSGMAMEMLLRRMKVQDATVHGFRSSFRDWTAEETSFPWEIAELCLAHKVGDDVEAAYRRTDLLEKRRLLLSAWADYCSGATSSNVVAFHG